ncbi:uncharacterized protein N7529_003059 [Penicillium soppii]|uniref:uncharacterized protein n=1 Tax=Penicillium soppii TaxID=69789 RepID=UPI002547BB48|nr:uncharacterized protein N7529_003059 [Penicillium soppii]KAJ5874629.1 hypothetical protein N7529_003059 [Penicillium soppii]
MVTTTIDHNPLDPNYAKRRSSLGYAEQPQKVQQDVKELVDRDVAPSPHAMCSELAHQHALDDLHKHTEHWSHQEVDHNIFLSDSIADRGLQAHPEVLGE